MTQRIISPLKTEFKPAYTIFDKQEITDRVNQEDNYTNCKGYPLTDFEDKIDILCPRIERVIERLIK